MRPYVLDLTLMKKVILFIFMLTMVGISAQNKKAFKAGEWLKFRLHYGYLNACYATLHLKNARLGSLPVYRIVAHGETTGFASVFFEVNDTYESYFDKKEIKPYKFIRKVSEGGYTKNVEINYDYSKGTAILEDKKHNRKQAFSIHQQIQDVLSAVYALRSKPNLNRLRRGQVVNMDVLFDRKGISKFRFKFLGTEILDTKFGELECLKFQPYVLAEKVFEKQENLTFWLSNDNNRIPVRVQANIAVGSIKADLDGYNGLMTPLNIISD